MQLFYSFIVLILMKRALTLMMASIFLVSGIQVSLARHYCGGKLVDVRISVTGQIATCGMEKSGSGCPDHPVFNIKCCEDQISFFGIRGNYYPEYFKLTHPTSERGIIPTQVGNFIAGNSYNSDIVNWVLPPGDNLKSRLTQPEICIFRI